MVFSRLSFFKEEGVSTEGRFGCLLEVGAITK